MIDAIKTALNTDAARARPWRMSMTAWTEEQTTLAKRVAKSRRYANGEHDADLTTEMEEMLRISGNDTKRFNDNYMDLIIQTEANRLEVVRFESDDKAANDDISAGLEANRFDGLQVNVTQATLRDGDTYVMVHFDDEGKATKLTHEPAYDGTNGMLVVLAPDNTVQIAIKVWRQSVESIGDTVFVAVYYDDHVELYSGNDSAVSLIDNTPYPTLKNEVLGQPVIHFKNRGTTYNGYGKGEIEDAIPLQDGLNRTLHSMVATSELTGFGIRFGVGVPKFDGALTPGMFLWIAEDGLDKDQQWALGTMEHGEIVPYIQQAEWLTAEMGRITRTPAPEFMGSSASSGEALKQREMGLLGKVKQFQVKAGNRWEDVIRMAWRVRAANGDAPAAFETLKTVWKDPEIRNETDIVANAKILYDMGLREEALRQMASVFEWNEAKILELLQQQQEEEQRTFTNNSGAPGVPNFAGFQGIQITNGGTA